MRTSNSLGKKELFSDSNINTPFYHQPYYRGERQLFGYNPSFQPNTVTFDKFNRPYILTTDTYESKSVPPVIQTIRNREWVELDYLKALPSEFANPQIKTGSFEEERVVFDRDDDIYILTHVIKPRYTFFLFHSSDYGLSWKAYELPFHSVWKDTLTFEYTGIDGNYDGVPLIFVRVPGKSAAVIHFTKLKDKSLSDPDIFYYGDGTVLNVGLHSGPPNPGVRVGNKVHIVWASSEVHPTPGTAQYATTVDLVTKEILPPVYLGSVGDGGDMNNRPDGHNMPSIVYDGEHLHVVLGAHQDRFEYVKSTTPNSTRTWTQAIGIGRPTPPISRYGNYTYVGLVIDQDKTLHLVSRYSGDKYTFKLVYMKKEFNKSWTYHKDLVIPFKTHYGVWYHKVSVDRLGRIFVSYKYYGDQLTEGMVDAYHARWPDSPKLVKNLPTGGTGGRMYSYKNIKPHDPVILISDDKGGDFRIATTSDFIHGFIRTADINRDGSVNSSDLAAVLTNWGECDDECDADINRDGRVGVDELSSVLVNWGKKI